MKALNDIINWIIQSGLLVWLFYFGFSVGKPFIDSKIKHAKTAQEKEAWTLLEQVAMTAVNARVGKHQTGQEKFINASTAVQGYLAEKGIDIDMKQVEAAVQSAYEKSPLTSTTNQEEKADKLGQKEPDLVPDGNAKAIDPKEVA
ncbi:MAG: phage holin family protein [Limosilactobacillus reuteri]|nr:phage holin family protein [Limosilactobacillus reuteri]